MGDPDQAKPQRHSISLDRLVAWFEYLESCNSVAMQTAALFGNFVQNSVGKLQENALPKGNNFAAYAEKR